jgi:lysophospholipase L1-like esterase
VKKPQEVVVPAPAAVAKHGHRRSRSRRWLWLLGGLVVALAVVATALLALGREPMGTWKSALDDRARKPARILAIGESTTEGQGATTRDRRWLDLLAAQLRSSYPVAGVVGGENYLPATYRVYAPDSTWGQPYASTGVVTPIFWGGNLGYRAITLNEGATATYPVVGDSVDLWYFTCPTCGTLSYRVDDGAETAVPTAEPYRTDARVQNVSLGAAASHSITITASSGTVHFGGLSVFNGDRDAGVQVYDASYSGATVQTYLSDEPSFMSSVASVAPDLVTIDLGGNDYLDNTERELFGRQLRQLVADLQALPKPPSILLIVPYEPTKLDAQTGDYAAYAQVLRDVAADNSADVTLLDLSLPEAMGSVAAEPGPWFSADGVHPNDAGYVRFKDLVYAAITG